MIVRVTQYYQSVDRDDVRDCYVAKQFLKVFRASILFYSNLFVKADYSGNDTINRTF